MRRILLLALTGIALPMFLPSGAKAQVVEVAPGGVVVHRRHYHHDWEREREWRERHWREHHRWHRWHHYHHDHDWD
jgi:hypothetical protein